MMLAVVLLAALAAPTAAPDAPETWAELKADLPNDKARRATALLRFAASDKPGLDDRLRAAKEARAHAPKRAASFALEARLHALAGRAAKRAQALALAAAAHAQLGENGRKELVLRAKKGDDELLRLKKLVEKRELAAEKAPPSSTPAPDAAAKAPALPEADEKLRKDVEEAVAAWTRLEDLAQASAARALLVRLQATVVGDATAAAAQLGEIAAELKGRDGAPTRAEIQQAQARLLESARDLQGAALASLSADRDAVVNLRRPASQEERPVYAKSRRSMELCRAARAQGVVCGRAEKKKFGDTLHYDWSQEARGPFDPEKSNEVLADFDTLLQECIRDAFKAGVPITQTTVELEWAVGLDGRVKEFDLRPTRLRKTSYEKCLRRAFDVFRYPPYSGEMQHVRLSFEVGGDI